MSLFLLLLTGIATDAAELERSKESFPPIPLKEMPALHRDAGEGRDEAVRFQVPGDPQARLEVAGDIEGGALYLSGGRGQSLQAAIHAPCIASHLRALTGDLNRDSINDFILLSNYGGNGRMAAAVRATMVLSSGDGYAVTALDFMEHDRFGGNFVLVDGQPVLCARTYYPGENFDEGINCNLWVYHLLEISGPSVRVNNALHATFPRLEAADSDSPCAQALSIFADQKSGLFDRMSPRLSRLKLKPEGVAGNE